MRASVISSISPLIATPACYEAISADQLLLHRSTTRFPPFSILQIRRLEMCALPGKKIARRSGCSFNLGTILSTASVAHLNARPDPNSSIAVPHRPAGKNCGVLVLRVGRSGRSKQRISVRHGGQHSRFNRDLNGMKDVGDRLQACSGMAKKSEMQACSARKSYRLK